MVQSKIGEHEHTVIAVSEFKSRCLELLEGLRQGGREIVITKRGEPIARVVPLRSSARPLRGSMKDVLRIRGDIVQCDWSDEWEATK
jgi:prevent-host-death family protein